MPGKANYFFYLPHFDGADRKNLSRCFKMAYLRQMVLDQASLTWY